MSTAISPTRSRQPSDLPKLNKILFESQKMGNAPSQTHYQLVVTLTEVILSDWPRKRFSQKWTREGAVNPSTKTVTHAAFLDGELKDDIKTIFGSEVLVNIIDLITEKSTTKTNKSVKSPKKA